MFTSSASQQAEVLGKWGLEPGYGLSMCQGTWAQVSAGFRGSWFSQHHLLGPNLWERCEKWAEFFTSIQQTRALVVPVQRRCGKPVSLGLVSGVFSHF